MARRLPASGPGRRPHGSITVPPALLIVCEGKTEKALLDGLRATWRIAQARVLIEGQAGVPETLVRRAIELTTAYKKDPVETWVVFDRDEHLTWRTAIERARAHQFGLAVSNPCIELWAMLLHQDQTAPLHRHEAQRLLALVHPAYHHEKHPVFSLPAVLAGLEAATQRAAHLDRRAREAGDPLGNPTTRVPALVTRLRALAD